jgi:hypothetical protein
MKFTSTLLDDMPQIARWIELDPFHCNRGTKPEWWITGADCYVAFCIEDDSGPVIYVRLEEDEDLIRLHCQFGPENEVSKRRVAVAISEALPAVEIMARQKGSTGLIYESSSPGLIKFLEKRGYVPAETNQFVKIF